MCTIGPVKMVGLFASLCQRHPAVKLQLKDAAAMALEDQLASGELDAAIYCRPEVLDERFHCMPLYRERFVVAFAPNHTWAQQAQIKFSDLHEQPYLNRINCEYNDHIDGIMARLGVAPITPTRASGTIGSSPWLWLAWAARRCPSTLYRCPACNGVHLWNQKFTDRSNS